MRISLTDYAKQRETTYEAVRKQVKLYEKDLEGHIFKEGRTRFLDDYAVNFLEERRNKNPVTVINNNKADELAAAHEKIAALEAKIDLLQNTNCALAAALIDKDKKLDAVNEKLQALSEGKKEEQPKRKGWFGIFK